MLCYCDRNVKSLIRYDRGIISLSGRKPVKTDDGTLLLDAVFARDGVLDYKILNGENMGVRKELRLPEENKKAIVQFGIIPVTDEHPPGLLDSSNSMIYRKGITLQSPRYETIPGKGGFVLGQIAVFDSALQERILSGEQVETSSGYKCVCEEKPGTYRHNDGAVYRYDAIQRNLEINHQAITRKGRAGSDVCVYLDSLRPTDEVGISVDAFHYDVFDSALKPTFFDMGRLMAQIHLDGATYEVTESVAAAIQSHLYHHDSIKKERDQANENLSAVLGERDALEFQLENAEKTLDSVGFVRDGEGDYRLDMSKAKQKMAEYEEEDDDEEEEDEEDSKEDTMKKGKKDSADDLAREYYDALYQADSILGVDEEGNSFSVLFKDHLDSAADVRRIVTQSLRPDINLDSYSDEQVSAMYDLAVSDLGDEEEEEEGYEDDENLDSDRVDYASNIAELIGSSRIARNAPPSTEGGVDNAWQQPLALSR